MAFSKNYPFLVFWAGIVVVVLVQSVGATAITFTVRAGEEEKRVLGLVAGDHVAIQFAVIGQDGNVLDFYVTDPHGTVIQSFSGVGEETCDFICGQDGEYTLHFSNVGSSVNKLVSLEYFVDYYILGMRQDIFLALVLVGICLASVAVFVIIGKAR